MIRSTNRTRCVSGPVPDRTRSFGSGFGMSFSATIAVTDSVTDEVINELLCPVCQERLDIPKSLNCLHCLCRKCVKLLIEYANKDNRDTFNCPTCREQHLIQTNGADAYKTHFTFSNIIELMTLRESEQTNKTAVKCSNRDDNNPAVQYCSECQCYLCQECVETHGSMKATRKHRIVPVDEIKKDPKKMVHKRYCSEHDDEELKLFCEETEEVICRDCELDDSHRDQKHTHKLIKSVIGDLKENLEQLVGKVREKHEEFKQHEQYIEEVTEKSEKNIGQCHKNIATYFEDYRSRLNRYEQDLHNSVDRHREESTKHITGEKEAVQISTAKLETGIQYTQKLLNEGSPVDVATMSKQTKKRLNNLSNESWDNKTVQTSQWCFLSNETDPFLTTIRGGISRSEIKTNGLTQPVVGENHFKVQLASGVESSTNPTVTLTRNGERLRNVEVIKEDTGSWNIKYQIPREGEYEIGVALDGIEAEDSPFKRIWRNKLTTGTTVDRGRDWKWGDQNGGPSNLGTVLGWAGDVGASENWVKVKWRNNRQNNYRWGADGAYDLMILSMPDLKFTVEQSS